MKKFLIIYNESLRSKVIYSDFLSKHKKKIEALIEIPTLVNTKLKLKFYKKFLFFPFHIKVYLLFNIYIYSLITKLNKSNIKNLCLRKNIPHYKYNYIIDIEKFLKKKKIKKRNLFIICATPNIIKLEKKITYLHNFHEADSQKYQGLFCIHSMIYNNDYMLKTTLSKINKELDKGDIVARSRKKNIKKFSIIYSYLYAWFLNSEILFKINKKQKCLNTVFKKKFISNRTNYTSEFFKKVSLRHKKSMTLFDILFLIKLCLTKKNISTYFK